MAGISAYSFVGNAAGIFESGWSPLVIYVANVMSFVVGALFLAAWYRQLRVITYAEAIKERFGKAAEQIVAHLIVFNNFLWAGVVLYTLAVFIVPLVPSVSVEGVIVVVGLVVVAYCTVGGNWAVMANDFVQGLVLIIVTIIVTTLCLLEAGGVFQFFDAIKQSGAGRDLQFLSPLREGENQWTMKYGILWLVITFVVQFMNQSSLFQGMRYFSAKDGREAAKASLLAGGLMALGLLLFFVPPIYARLFLEPEVMEMHEKAAKAVEYSYSVTSRELLPEGTFSIMIVAIFAAAISSLDTGLNRNSAIIVRDLLPRYRKLLKLPPLSSHRELFVGKVTTVASGMIVLALSLVWASNKEASIFDMKNTTLLILALVALSQSANGQISLTFTAPSENTPVTERVSSTTLTFALDDTGRVTGGTDTKSGIQDMEAAGSVTDPTAYGAIFTLTIDAANQMNMDTGEKLVDGKIDRDANGYFGVMDDGGNIQASEGFTLGLNAVNLPPVMQIQLTGIGVRYVDRGEKGILINRVTGETLDFGREVSAVINVPNGNTFMMDVRRLGVVVQGGKTVDDLLALVGLVEGGFRVYAFEFDVIMPDSEG